MLNCQTKKIDRNAPATPRIRAGEAQTSAASHVPEGKQVTSLLCVGTVCCMWIRACFLVSLGFFVCVCLFESCVVHAVSPMLRVWFFGLVLFNGLYCYLAGKGEAPKKAKFQLRFLLLFGIYGGVFFVFDCWRISGTDLLGDLLLVANQNCKKNSDLHDIGTFQNRIFHRP